MKIGLMGGSFDPVHFGHLIAARDVLEKWCLDRLFLVPAAQAPLKPRIAQATASARLAMLKLAIEGDQRIEVSDFELKKSGVSFTIETVRHFRAQFPGDDIYWVIGADQLAVLHKWKEIGELAKMTEFIFLERPGYPVDQRFEVPEVKLRRCEGHLIEISSSEVRIRAKAGLSLEYLCPEKVIAYIEDNGLYR